MYFISTLTWPKKVKSNEKGQKCIFHGRQTVPPGRMLATLMVKMFGRCCSRRLAVRPSSWKGDLVNSVLVSEDLLLTRARLCVLVLLSRGFFCFDVCHNFSVAHGHGHSIDSRFGRCGENVDSFDAPITVVAIFLGYKNVGNDALRCHNSTRRILSGLLSRKLTSMVALTAVDFRGNAALASPELPESAK